MEMRCQSAANSMQAKCHLRHQTPVTSIHAMVGCFEAAITHVLSTCWSRAVLVNNGYPIRRWRAEVYETDGNLSMSTLQLN